MVNENMENKNMNIQVEEKESCKVQVTYKADPEKVLKKRSEIVDKIFEETSKLAVPGYRKGKAPLSAIKMRYRKNIEEQTRQNLLVAAEEEILFETKLKTLFSTQVLKMNLNEDLFECELLFFKKPIFELKQYKGLSVPRPHSPKTQAELSEQIMQELRVRYGDVVPFAETDKIELTDKITMDVNCKTEGLTINELTKDGVFYTVGQGFYHEFDDNILGMTTGEEKTFDVLWDTQTKERATFTVKVHMGVKMVPAPLEDSFAQKLGLENFEKLASDIGATAANKIKDYERDAVHSQIISQLMAAHEIEVPHWLIEMDAQQLAMQHSLKWSEVDPESKKTLEAKAVERLKLTLIMDAIRDAEPETQFSNNEILDVVRSRVAQQGQDPDKFVVEMQRTGRLFGVVAALQQEATLEFLAKNTNIVE